MSVTAYVLNYRCGVVCPMALDAILAILDPLYTTWNEDDHRLTVRFSDPDETVDIYFGYNAVSLGKANGLRIERPLSRSDFLHRMYQLLQLDNVMIFYSDETTPIFHRSSDPSEYPTELLAELGSPRYVDSPNDLLPLN